MKLTVQATKKKKVFYILNISDQKHFFTIGRLFYFVLVSFAFAFKSN